MGGRRGGWARSAGGMAGVKGDDHGRPEKARQPPDVGLPVMKAAEALPPVQILKHPVGGEHGLLRGNTRWRRARTVGSCDGSRVGERHRGRWWGDFSNQVAKFGQNGVKLIGRYKILYRVIRRMDMGA